jgi:hypothetical protein
MIKLTFLFSTLLLIISACGLRSNIIELQPSDSMSITGKGLGQDAAINPYADGKSLAVVKNLGKNSFEYRVQRAGSIIENKSILSKESKVIELEKGDELYFDSRSDAKAKVAFTRRSNQPLN